MRPSSFAETSADTCFIVFLSSRNDAYRMHGAAAYYALNGLECSKKSPSAITPPTVTRSPRLNACHRLSNGREVSYSVKGCSNGIKKGGQMGGVSLPTPLHICATLFHPRARTVSACMTAVSSLLGPIRFVPREYQPFVGEPLKRKIIAITGDRVARGNCRGVGGLRSCDGFVMYWPLWQRNELRS